MRNATSITILVEEIVEAAKDFALAIYTLHEDLLVPFFGLLFVKMRQGRLAALHELVKPAIFHNVVYLHQEGKK